MEIAHQEANAGKDRDVQDAFGSATRTIDLSTLPCLYGEAHIVGNFFVFTEFVTRLKRILRFDLHLPRT
jgi:hypothetical protein